MINGIIIELYQVTCIEVEELKKRKDGPVEHIAFDVKDVEKAFLELKDAEIVLIEEKPVTISQEGFIFSVLSALLAYSYLPKNLPDILRLLIN